jgi:hypothetical protein
MPQTNNNPNFFERYKGEIEDLIGIANNVESFDTYNEALQRVGKLDEYKNNVSKITDMQNRLLQVDTDKVPKTKTVDKEVFSSDYLRDAELKDVESMTGYTEYFDRTTAKNETPIGINDYLTQRPDLYAQVKTKYSSAFQNKKSEQNLTPDEMLASYYKEAGIAPEDVAWYQENKGKYKATKYNEKLTDLMNEYIPYFMGRDETSQQYGALLGGRIDKEMIKPTKYEYQKIGNDLYRFDTWGMIEKIVDGEEKQEWTVDAQIPVTMFEDNGKFYARQTFKNKKAETTQREVEVTKGDYDTWLRNREIQNERLSGQEKQELKFGSINIGGFDIPGGKVPGSGKGKTGKGDGIRLDEKWEYNDMIYLAKNRDNPTVDKSDYAKLKKQFLKDYNYDEQGFKILMSKVENMTEKQAKQYFHGIENKSVDVKRSIYGLTVSQIQERINRYPLYKEKLTKAYQTEQSDPSKKGVFDQELLKFFNEIGWDLQHGIINQESYDAFQSQFKRY